MAEIRAVSADNNDIDLAPDAIICGMWLVADAADASCLIYDSATVTGTAKASLACLAKTQTPFIPLEGVKFRNGISVDMTGAGAILYFLVE